MDVNGFGTLLKICSMFALNGWPEDVKMTDLGAREQLEQKHDGLHFIIERHEDTDGIVEYTLEKYGSALHLPVRQKLHIVAIWH